MVDQPFLYPEPTGLFARISPQDKKRLSALGSPNTLLDPYVVTEQEYRFCLNAIGSDHIAADPTCVPEGLLVQAEETTTRLGNGDPAAAITSFRAWGLAMGASKNLVMAKRFMDYATIIALRWQDQQGTLGAGAEEGACSL